MSSDRGAAILYQVRHSLPDGPVADPRRVAKDQRQGSTHGSSMGGLKEWEFTAALGDLGYKT